MLTTVKVAVGEFSVLWNGKPTGWSIFNGDRGTSGRDPNMYGIGKGDKVIWVGSLAACKKLLKDKLAGKI